jgi:hypothetical protein
MHQVSARNLPGSDASRKFEGGKHVLFVLEHNNPGDGATAAPASLRRNLPRHRGPRPGPGRDGPFEGGPGDIAIAPPGIPLGFTNLGPGKARLI